MENKSYTVKLEITMRVKAKNKVEVEEVLENMDYKFSDHREDKEKSLYTKIMDWDIQEYNFHV